MKKISRIVRFLYDITKEPFSYFVTLLGLISIGREFLCWLLDNIFKFNIFVRVGLVCVLLFIFILFLFNLKRIFSYFSYLVGKREIDLQINKISKNNIKKVTKYDFEKIIPQTALLRYVYDVLFSRAQKTLYRDCYCSGQTVSVRIENGRLNGVDMDLQFYSPFKNIEVRYTAYNLQIPAENSKHLSYSDKAICSEQNLLNPLGRVAVVLILEKFEYELIGRKSISIKIRDYVNNKLRLSILIDSEDSITKSLNFQCDINNRKILKEGKLIKEDIEVATF